MFRFTEVQIALALVIGLRLATRDWTIIAERPPVLTDPSWLTSWIPFTPSSALLIALQVVGIGSVAAVVTRRFPNAGFAAATLCYMFLTAWWGSSGKVMHNDLLTVTVAIVFLVASIRRRPVVGVSVAAGWPPRAALIVIAAIYFLTGLQKLRHSGAEWVFSDNMAWVLRQGLTSRAQELGIWVADLGWPAQLLAGGALLLELSAPLLLAVRKTRLPFVLGVAAMHTSVWFFLGLDYSAWILTVAAVAIPMAMPPGRRLINNRVLDEDD